MFIKFEFISIIGFQEKRERKEKKRRKKKKEKRKKKKGKKKKGKKEQRTRPDTRPPVADGWAGAEMRVFPLFNSSVTDRRTDGPTNGRTDGRTDKASYRIASP